MIGFIEGSMEKQFLNLNFDYLRVIPIQNGIQWTCNQLCNQIVNAYLALNYHGDVFVWLDRERRTETAAFIRSEIRASLIASGADPDRLYILVSDRMVENMILADEVAIRQEFNDPTYVYNYEGSGGKHILKTMYRAQDVNYKEMVQGAKLLKKIRVSNSAANSPSVAAFYDECGLNCLWF